jgi:hypothetical protein
MQKLLIFKLMLVFLIFVLGGCINSFQDIIIDDTLYQNAPRDKFVFNSVKLHQNLLKINISYSGGCEEHLFLLVATSFMESYPVQVNVLLSHEDNNDPCDMWITKTLVFNLVNLKESWQNLYQEESGTIIMNIDGWEDPIYYEF